MTQNPITTHPPEARVIQTRPLDTRSKMMRAKFAETYVNQSEQMDRLAVQLITLEIAIPGIYASVLRLMVGEQGTIAKSNWIVALTFALWSIALALTLWSLFPREWTVDENKIAGNPQHADPNFALEDDRRSALSLEEFFFQSARHKRRLLVAATVAFWLGVISAAWMLF